MNGLTVLGMFLLFFPKTFLETVILVETNKKIKGEPVAFGKFL
jgi:hypothetical protein